MGSIFNMPLYKFATKIVYFVFKFLQKLFIEMVRPIISAGLNKKCPCLALFLLLLMNSCGHNENIPDISNINVSLKTYRIDKELYTIDTNHISDGLKKLQAK